jgi:DNA-binding response OmpR family regulator
MIVDDDPDVTMTLQTVLQQNGFRTDAYDDPVAVYKNFRDGVYDLVLLDIKMPIIDGFLLYQKIRRTDKIVKICFLTAKPNFIANGLEKNRDLMNSIKNLS